MMSVKDDSIKFIQHILLMGDLYGTQVCHRKSRNRKSEYIMEEIKKKSMEDPHGPPIFYLVPDQMTFEQEYALFKDQSFQGSIRTQVASFSRLAWRVLQETGG